MPLGITSILHCQPFHFSPGNTACVVTEIKEPAVWLQNCQAPLMPRDRVCEEKYKVHRQHRFPSSTLSPFMSWVCGSVVDSDEDGSATVCLAYGSFTKTGSVSLRKLDSSDVPLLLQCGVSSASLKHSLILVPCHR